MAAILVLCLILLTSSSSSLYAVGGGGSYDPALEIQWWRDWDASYNFPPGVSGRPANKMWTVGKVDNRLDGPPASTDTSIANIDHIFAYEKGKIAQLIQEGYTGNYWEIANEPNWYPHFSPANYAYQFHLYCIYIKGLDPTAKCVLGGLSLYDPNWSNWLDDFRSIYAQRYGVESPIDVWGIHPYDIFDAQAGQRTINKIVSFRTYLGAEGIIWITEFGKGNWQYEPEENVITYLVIVTDWLNANHRAYKIDRWFWWGILTGEHGMGSNGLFHRGPYSLETITPVGVAYLAQRDKLQEFIAFLPIVLR